jgi:hypothetical protein
VGWATGKSGVAWVMGGELANGGGCVDAGGGAAEQGLGDR